MYVSMELLLFLEQSIGDRSCYDSVHMSLFPGCQPKSSHVAVFEHALALPVTINLHIHLSPL